MKYVIAAALLVGVGGVLGFVAGSEAMAVQAAAERDSKFTCVAALKKTGLELEVMGRTIEEIERLVVSNLGRCSCKGDGVSDGK